MTQRFTDQQLIALHKEGLNDREKAERLGVSHFRVKYRRRKLGIESIRSRRSYINHQRFLKLYERGLNDPEIADALGVTIAMAYNYRKRHDLASNWKLSFTDQQFLELYEEGLNDPRIAEKLDVTKDAVKQRRQKLGLKAHGYVRLFTDEELIALHIQGLNDREKAERLGASIEVVYYHRRRLGLKPLKVGRKVLEVL